MLRCRMDPESRIEKPIWGTVREVVSCELVDELAPREYITMRPSHDISHPDTYCTGNDGS